MKIIDVTLRDGGFATDFDWDINAAGLYLNTLSTLSVAFVEVGYWKQTAKSQNSFYNFSANTLQRLTANAASIPPLAIMVDYHYCTKDLSEYPCLGETPIEMIRITSRKEDFSEAIKFAEKLKNKTKLLVSFQIINVTNYSKSELTSRVECLNSFEFIDIVGFADSHGNLNLIKDSLFFTGVFDLLDEQSKKWGFHLHNHTDRATMNYYWLIANSNCGYIDASVNGLGKGMGNLALENVLRNEEICHLLHYLVTSPMHPLKTTIFNALCNISGRLSCTDNYAKLAAARANISVSDFYNILCRIRGVDRDTFNMNEFNRIHEYIGKFRSSNSPKARGHVSS